jgi:NAD(P)-dependent dehydrogenase (short-subunit alcohol dehydrogenase family)
MPDESFPKEKRELENKVVLITGASRGIGKALALAFAQRNCRLVMMARDSQRLAKAAEEVRAGGASVLALALDVSSEVEIRNSLNQVREKFGAVEILVNNAGIYKTSPVAAHSTQVWQEIMNTNLTSAFFFCRELVQPMIDSGWGRVINISSISGKHAEMHGAAYSASKFGMIGLTQALALETANKGITVNALCPGWVDTDMARAQLSDPDWCKLNSIDVEESLDIARFSIPQMRFIQPDEVAALAVYLCTPAAQGITGQAINICGGMCLS